MEFHRAINIHFPLRRKKKGKWSIIYSSETHIMHSRQDVLSEGSVLDKRKDCKVRMQGTFNTHYLIQW